MPEKNLTQRRRKKVFQRLMSFMLVCAMLFADILPILSEVKAASGLTAAPPLAVTFQSAGEGTANYTDDGQIMLSMENTATVGIELAPRWNQNQGKASGTVVSIRLPWIYYDKKNVISFGYDKSQIVSDGGVIVGGIEASFQSTADSAWYSATSASNSEIEDVKDSDGKDTSYKRNLLQIRHVSGSEFNETRTFNISLKFFTLEGVKLPEGVTVAIPENASANLMLGASYEMFVDSDKVELGGFWMNPGTSGSGDRENDKHTLTLINSNLKWDITSDVIEMPVLWDQYNYAVYEVTIKNTSEPEHTASIVDHFQFILRVPNESYSSNGGGVLEKDMMAWIYDENTGQLVPNSDISSGEIRENSFGGKYQEGGVLVWDMTGKDTTDFNVAEYAAQNPSEFNYIYASPGEIGVKVKEEVTPGEKRVYYVAIPYVNNFGSDYSHEITTRETIYFGKRDFAWSKSASAAADFIIQSVSFVHDKYLEKSGSQVDEKEYYIGTDATYYLDKFENTSNTPVFNTYIVDTLPDYFEIQQLQFEMKGQASKLEDWFMADSTSKITNLLDIVYFKFLVDGAEEWVSLNDLGATYTNGYDSAVGVNLWTVTGIDQLIENYVIGSAASTCEFAREFKVLFKERIEVGEKLEGRIAVGGQGDYLLSYTNTLNTYYERWNWMQATADLPEGYFVEQKQIAEADTALLVGQHAKPLNQGYGVYYVTEDDGSVTEHKNSETNSSTGEKYQPVSIGVANAAVRFELGNGNDSVILPGVFSLDTLLVKNTASNVWEGLLADTVKFSSDLLAKSKIQKVIFTYTDGTKCSITWPILLLDSDYNNGVISKKLWEDLWRTAKAKPSTAVAPDLTGIEIEFEEFDGGVSLAAGSGAYIEIQGIPNAVKKLVFEGSFSTLYNEHPAVSALGTVTEDVMVGKAILDVREVIPTVEATANWKAQKSTLVTNPLVVPHDVSNLHPADPVYYEFKVGNNSLAEADTVHLTLDLLSVQDIDSTANEIIKGFDTEKIVIKSGYDAAMTIDHIELYDESVDMTAATVTPSVTISNADLATYTDPATGDLVIDLSKFSTEVNILKTARIVCSSFSNEIKGDDRAVLQVYGNTDGYNDYYADKRLQANLTFEPIGMVFGTANVEVGKAAFSVEAPALTIYNDIYQLNVTSGSVSSTTNTDKNEKTLGVPYARDFTYRVELKNDTISLIDDVSAVIDLPDFRYKDGAFDGGFHPTSVIIYKDLLDQYSAFEKIEFVTSGTASTSLWDLFASGDDPTVTYDASAQTISYNGDSYTLIDGKYFEIPIKDILSGDQVLEQIIVTGKDFSISTGKTISPYLEINGWSDSPIESKDVLTTTATNYLDGLRDLVPVHSAVSKDTSVAYISQMYYDTTIVAGFQTSATDTKRYERVSTPVEDIRLQYKYSNSNRWNDNSELEIGYKGLGSYAVDFSQHLDKTAALPTNDGGEYSQEFDSLSYIKQTSFNTAATVQMTVELPEDYFEAYYLKIDARAKDYIEKIEIVRADGSKYELPMNKAVWRVEDNYCRINLLNTDEEAEFLSADETYYYQKPDTDYAVQNPVSQAIITLKINQDSENADGTAKVPDYGTWWENSDQSSQYMFEFAGRFYKVGTAGASVSTQLTIGNVDGSDDRYSSVVRSTTGTASNHSGASWSFKNYYNAHDWYGSNWANNIEYKADDLYSTTNVIVVRDYNRITKGATSDATKDYNYDAKIAGDNQYYIDFKRASRRDVYHTDFSNYWIKSQYEAGVSTSNWCYQDDDDWYQAGGGKVGYADKVSIIDTLGKIEVDAIYDYKGTLTTGISIHKDIYAYMHEDAAILLTLGKGTTTGEQQSNIISYTIKKSDLVLNGDYYGFKFDNSADAASEIDRTLTFSNGILYLEKNQFPLKFEAILWDIEGDGEYLSELGWNADGTAYVQANGLRHSKANLSNTKDIIVHVKPYLVYGVDSSTDAENHVTTKTYEDFDGYVNASNSIMFNDSSSKGSWIEDYARIMGYRRPFEAGQQLIPMGRTEIDEAGTVTADGVTTITEYRTEDTSVTYNRLDVDAATAGTTESYTREENLTPTNAQFGVKIFNETVTSTDDKSIPVRIKQAVSTNTMNEFYRMRNLYIPVQWINTGVAVAEGSTESGQWFHITNMNIKINGEIYSISADVANSEFDVKKGTTTIGSIPFIKKTVDSVECYVLNIEDFARDNMTTEKALVDTTSGLARVKVEQFVLTFDATNWDLDKDSTLLCNGQYLSADKTTNGFAYFYDGVYVERPVEEFMADSWTLNSVPTFGKSGNYYAPYYSSTNSAGERTVVNYINTQFTSADVEANTFAWASNTNTSNSYELRNAVAILSPSITKVRTATSGTESLFAYDLTNAVDETDVEVDIDHILPYDYIEYALSAESLTQSEVLLPRMHLDFVVPEGQQLVGWKFVSSTVEDSKTKDAITKGQISAVLYDAAGNSITADPEVNYSAVVAADGTSAEETGYKKISFVFGNEGTVVKPGQGVKILIITQTTDEMKTAAGEPDFEGRTFTSNMYVWAEPQHGYSQYAIDGYDGTNYATGYTELPSSTAQNRGYKRPSDVNTSDLVYYFRHYNYAGVDTGTYVAQLENTLKFYNNKDVSIVFSFDDLARKYDGQGATITVDNIKNDTMHYLREQTVMVDFVDSNGDQGFHLTKLPTTSIAKADGGDIYYPDDFIAAKGSTPIQDILVECRVDIDKDGTEEWKSAADVTAAITAGTITMENITAVRWTYYDLLPGYDKSGSQYKDMMTFDPVVLVGTAAYEDIRKSTNAAANVAMVDQYKGVYTATITHVHEHSEDVTIVDGDEGTRKVVRNKDIILKNTKADDELIYREVPQVILHPQVFDDAAAAQGVYDESAVQKTGYRPNQMYWQKITLINREMVTNGNQTARQGRLFNPVIYDKLPSDYVSIVADTMGVKWYDIEGKEKTGTYTIQVETVEVIEEEDYGGAMIYKKSGLQTTGLGKAFKDFAIDADHTYKTTYTVQTYTVVDETGNPITMEVGDRLILYYQLKVAEDGLPMVYVDQDANLSTEDDRHPGYFPRMGEYYQDEENGSWSDGRSWPFMPTDIDDAVHPRKVENQSVLMDMDYLLHDVGVTAQLNEHVDRWEFLKDSIVFIPGSSMTQNDSYYIEYNFDGDNGVLGDYDISSANNMQKTVYIPSTNAPNGAGEDELPDSHTLQHPTSKLARDWYEKVIEKRITDEDNWGSDTPIIWGENRLHLQKAWLVGASEFVSTNAEQRVYEATSGDGLTDGRASNPNYGIRDGRHSYSDQYNYVHALTDDNFETALEYNQYFDIKLQALNYGDWDLNSGVEFIYTFPAGIEPAFVNEDGSIDTSKITVGVLNSVSLNGNDAVNESYTATSNFAVEVIQKPGSSASYSAPTEAQDPIWQGGTLAADYPQGEDTTPWVIRIVVSENLNQWFGRGSESGYKFYVKMPAHVVRNNDNEEWFDRLQVKPVTESNQDYYYYQIMDIDHWEGTTRTNMHHNQRFGMDYLWYRGSYSGFVSSGTYHYYNGSMNTPYINGYNIQNQEVTMVNGVATAVNNAYNYKDASDSGRYAQTGTRAVMRKPVLRQWTTVGNDIDGTTVSDYYVNTEVDNVKFNIHVENKYYWDALGTNGGYNSSLVDNYYSITKELHSYATDGGARGAYILPVITNILPYGIAPIGKTAKGEKDVYSTDNSKNSDLTLSWELLGLNGETIDPAEQELYETSVSYELIQRIDAEGNPVMEDGKVVVEGRFVVRIYAKANADAGDSAKEAKIFSGEGRTFSFDAYTYDGPKVDTLQGEENPDLADFYENNYTYISSKIDNFKALIDEDIAGNQYTVGSQASPLNRYDYSANYATHDSRPDAIQKVYSATTSGGSVTQMTHGTLPNAVLQDKVTGINHHVIGQGMERVFENQRTNASDQPVYNIEDYVYDSSTTQIRDYLVLNEMLTDFNMNEDATHVDYTGSSEEIGDVAFVNTTKIRTRKANLVLENYVGATAEETGVKTPTLTAGGNENVPGSVEYDKLVFDYGDEVWYTAKITNIAKSKTDYARQGAIQHSRFVFSFYLPDTVTYVGDENWDKWQTNDFVIELVKADGSKVQITPDSIQNSGWGIRVINKEYVGLTDTTDHTGQVVTFEVVTASDMGFKDYSSYAEGLNPPGHLAYGDSLVLKIRTRLDNKEAEGIDPSNDTNPDVWTGYYSEVYATLHTTNGDYIITDKGNIYDDAERSQITGEVILYDGYKINESALEKYGFPMQTQIIKTVDFRDKVVEDEVVEGSLTADYDRDGQEDSTYSVASSGWISVWKPEATVRIDTSELRRVISDANMTNRLVDDAHVRSSDIMDIRLNQVVNDQSNVNEFVVNLDIPYRGTDKGTSQIAGMDAKAMMTMVKEIRTGNWEIPESYKDTDAGKIYEEHLKVYVYGLMVENPWSISGYESPYFVDTADARWVSIGDEAGYKLSDNKVITSEVINQMIEDYRQQYGTDQTTSIYQLKFVITMEAFSDENGKSYTQEEAAINYPVPKGLRMAIDSEGVSNQEINISDPKEENTDEQIMHHESVVKNCAYVSINTSMLDTSDGILKHVNFYGSAYAKYDDHKISAISKSNRAGYYIDPELPTLEIEYEQGYFKGTTAEVEGIVQTSFAWDYNNSAINVEMSNILKYRATMKNRKESEEDGIKIEDNATNPIITIALPYNEIIDVTELQYIDYEEESNYLKDSYTSSRNLNNATPLWTWYIVDSEGNVIESTGFKALEVSEDSPVQTSKKLSVYRTENSKIFNFYFTGQLKPGENLVVEVMVPILRMNANSTSDELLRSKAYISKSGAFLDYVPDTGAVNAAAYEYDSQDVNENGLRNDTCITKETSALTFTTIDALGQTKLVDTDLETNVSSKPAAVTEGGSYTFKASSVNLTNASGYEFTKNIIFDVLPHVGDTYVYQTTYQDGESVESPRESTWNGWLDIDSLVVKEGGSGTLVDSENYTIWVGPIVKAKDGSCSLQYDTDGMPVLPDAMYVNDPNKIQKLATDDTEKAQYFVKLDELKTAMNAMSAAEQENLIKGIRAIWLQMKDEYRIGSYGRLELSYEMRAPLNVPKYVGTVAVDDTSTVAPEVQIKEAVKDYTGWNTFLTRAYSLINTTYSMREEAVTGVYVDAPSNRGYIGSYVWSDVDFDGLIDEGTYADTYGIGRDVLVEAKYDLDGDGTADDPGINGVLVELLSKNGRPVNKDGQAVMENPDLPGTYIILDDETGLPDLIDEGSPTERYQITQNGPVSFVTESDYYGNQGYFVMTDLNPGEYNLRYTFPKEYVNYSVSTKELNSSEINKTGVEIDTPVIVYREGEVVYNASNALTNTTKSDAQKAAYAVPQDTLVVQTAKTVVVKAVEEDQTTTGINGMTLHEIYDRQTMGYNLGVGAARMYKGTTWLDETEQGSTVLIDGIMDEKETRLGKISVAAYEVDPNTGNLISSTPALTTDGNLAVYVTSDTASGDLLAGEFEFRLIPGKSYVIRALNEDAQRVLKPTAPIYSNDPSADTKYNDLLLEAGKNTTKPFSAVYVEGAMVEGWETFEETHTIDLGFVDSSRGFVGEYVWDDANYDGLQDLNESGIGNVTVTLESYYYKDGVWISTGQEQTTTTNAAGAFKFTVSTFRADGDDRYLLGYKVRIDRDDNEDLFAAYGATWKDKASNGTQSDMDEAPNAQGSYYLNDEPVLVAKPKSADTNADYEVSFENAVYDLANADTVKLDAGFKSYAAGDLDGILWLDADYDGIRELDEIVADVANLTTDEANLQKIQVVLDSYYYDGSVWNLIDAAARTSGLTLGTDQFYHYHFEGLETSYDKDGKTYLMGYKVRLQNVDGSLRQTLRYQGTNDETDSNLEIVSGQYELNLSDEYIILADKLGSGAGVHGATVTWDGNIYDMYVKRDIESYDAGFKSCELSTISGNIWIDLNYDGIMNDQLPDNDILENKEVVLQRYIVEEKDGELVYTLDSAYGKQSAFTDITGAYTFTDLSNYAVDSSTGKVNLYAYKLSVDDQQIVGESFCGITKIHQGEDPDLDSDWLRDKTLRPNTGEYLILLKEADVHTPAENLISGYDIVKAADYTTLNAGVGVIQHGTISGTIFDDTDYDGIFEEDESGKAGITVYLTQYMKVEGKDEYEATGAVAADITDVNGYYEFTDLPAFGRNMEDKLVLYAYRLVVEDRSLPAGYRITKYQVAEDGRDSHLDKNTLELIADKNVWFTDSDEPYIILANETQDTQVMYYGEGYDMADGIHVAELDGGITNYRQNADNGKISGTIFDDKDYDGIFDQNETGKEGITIYLTQYMKVPGKQLYEATGSVLTAETDENGNYEFANLPTFGLNMEDELALYAYRIVVEGETIPADYKISKYLAAKTGRLSHLDEDTLELISDEEVWFENSTEPYIILAEKTDDKDVLYYHEGYDMGQSIHVAELDGGITNYRQNADNGKISGTIFDDKDYDGIFDQNETGKEGVTIYLTQYMKVPGKQLYEATGSVLTTETDENGNYEFANLPTFGLNMEDELALYAYRIVVEGETIPADYKISKYLAAKTGRLSHLDEDTLELISDEEVWFENSTEPYIILAEKTDDKDVLYYHESYDMGQSIHVAELDGGITNYRQNADNGKISGTIFVDKDQDGIFDEEEKGRKDIVIILTQYMKAPGADIYEATGGALVTVTDENGNYEFANLPTFGLNMEDELVLYAYRVTVWEGRIPKGYEVTKYLADGEGRVSRLDSETLELICGEEVRISGSTEPYIILAEKTDDLDVLYYHEGYNMGESIHVQYLDGGITHNRPLDADTGKISGTIFDDLDQDGIFDEEEKGVKGVSIILKQYSKTSGEDTYTATGGSLVTVTDENGNYAFTELPTYGLNVEENLTLYAYRVYVLEESIPEGYDITKYLADKAGRVSRLDSSTLELISSEKVHFKGSKEPFIIMALQTEDAEALYYAEGYDVSQSIQVEALDGGIFSTKVEPGPEVDTGDDANPWLYALICFGSFIALAMLIKKRKTQ